MPDEIEFDEIVVKNLKYETAESESSGETSDEVTVPSLRQNESGEEDSDSGEVIVLSPSTNAKLKTPSYFAKWARGSETSGSVDENTTYVEDSASFTDATGDEVVLSLSLYQFDIVGTTGRRYSESDYKSLTLGEHNTITIRFEFPTDARPAYIDDILSGVVYAIRRDEAVVEAAGNE